MKPLYKLIYSSTRQPNCTSKDIEDILESCKKNNPGKNVTGVLLHSDHKFIQYIEGSSEEVIGLYDKIKDDKRHKNVVMLSYSPINKRIFPSWHMGYRNVDEVEFQSDITDEDKKVFDSMIAGEKLEDDLGISLLKRFFQRDRP